MRRVAKLAREVLAGRLSARQVVRIALRVARFEAWGVRPITQSRFAALHRAAERDAAAAALLAAGQAEIGRLQDAHAAAAAAERQAVAHAGRTTARNVALDAELARARDTLAHLRRVEAAWRDAAERTDAQAARIAGLEAEHQDATRGMQALLAELQRLLFDIAGPTAPSQAAATLMLADRPVGEALATLVNLSEPAHGARAFQLALPILAPVRPFPLPWPAHLGALRIVDVGSQKLETEADMHAPLRQAAPLDITGFDPFAVADAPENRRTVATLLGNGSPTRFHVNRYDATSSTLPTNHALTAPFGLLDLAMQTLHTRTLPTARLDDVLAHHGDPARVDLLKIDVQGAAHTVLAHAAGVLSRTLVCHVEAEFAPIYEGEALFAEIDQALRQAGFCFVDFFALGRQRYASFDASPARAFHRGRTLWADAIYIRALDPPAALDACDLFRAACIVHCCYNKQDLAAELLARHDGLTGGGLLADYLGPVA